MPSFTITLEDTSPLIRYSPNWSAGTSGDQKANQYSESSFTLTQKQGDSLQFNFYGTQVALFGAKRGNHGVYQVQLDGGSITSSNGSSSTDIFNQVLYDSGNTTLGQHTMTLTNGENLFFDVDYITFQTNVGTDNEDLIVNSFEDNHPSFSFTPTSSWRTPDKVGWFSGSTGQVTTDSAAVAKFTFKGDAVALFGPVGPNGTDNYSVAIDGKGSTQYSAKKQFYKPQEMLFYNANLGSGEHTLQIQINSAALGELAIDYANVYTSSSLGGSFLGSASPNIITVHDTKTPIGFIVGIAITSALALIASVICFYLVWRNKRGSSGLGQQKEYPVFSQVPLNQPTVANPSFVSSPATTRSGNHTTIPSISYTSTSGAPSSAAAYSAIATAHDSAATQYTTGYQPQGKRNLAQSSETRDSAYISPPQYTTDQ